MTQQRVPREKKPKTPKQIAWGEFSPYIRLRDCLKTTGTKERCICITCGHEVLYSQIQAGHFIPGRGNAVLFSEEQTNGQCKQCNFYKGGLPLVYRKVMVERYGEVRVQEMEMLARIPKKWKPGELEMIALHYKQEHENLEAL